MNAIKQTLLYFHYFNYPPTEDELYLFLPVSMTREMFTTKVKSMLNSKKITVFKGRYTLGGHGILTSVFKKRNIIAGKKWKKAIKVTSVLKILPYIEYIGVSGSLSMNNTEKIDDIDLFIVTSKNRLFTGRFITSLIIDIFGIRRRRNSKDTEDRICLNLFFDRSDLKVPVKKRNIYVAHELLQLKTLYDKNEVYNELIQENKWIYRVLPNSKEMSDELTIKNFSRLKLSSGFSILEVILRKIQLYIMSRHQTTEIITKTQLWFFPQDVEKQLKDNAIIPKSRKG